MKSTIKKSKIIVIKKNQKKMTDNMVKKSTDVLNTIF